MCQRDTNNGWRFDNSFFSQALVMGSLLGGGGKWLKLVSKLVFFFFLGASMGLYLYRYKGVKSICIRKIILNRSLCLSTSTTTTITTHPNWGEKKKKSPLQQITTNRFVCCWTVVVVCLFVLLHGCYLWVWTRDLSHDTIVVAWHAEENEKIDWCHLVVWGQLFWGARFFDLKKKEGWGEGGGGVCMGGWLPMHTYFDFVPQIKPTKFSQPLDGWWMFKYYLVSDDFETFIQN